MGTYILFILIGMILMGIVVWIMMPKLMMTTHKSESDFENTKTALVDKINVTGNWKVTNETDFQKGIHDSDFEKIEKVGSLSLCNPRYASNILAEEPNRKVTSIMPIAIGVYEDKNHNVYVSQLNLRLMGMMFGGTIAKVMSVAGKDVKEFIASATKNR